MCRGNRPLPVLACLLLLQVMFLTGPPGGRAADAVRINGSGTCLTMLTPLIEAYGRQNRIVLFEVEKPLGSSGAIKALLAGAIDIAAVSRPLKPEEKARGARLTPYGRTPLAIVTEKSIPLKNISTAQLEDIYSARTGRWPDGGIIRIILRPGEDTDTKILRSLSPGLAAAVDQARRRRGVLVAVTDTEANEAVARISGGIGTAGLAGVLAGKLPLNVLTLNGVAPSRANLANRTYPLAKEISFVTTGRLSAAAAKFLQFIYSDQGRSLAEQTGVWVTGDSP